MLYELWGLVLQEMGAAVLGAAVAFPVFHRCVPIKSFKIFNAHTYLYYRYLFIDLSIYFKFQMALNRKMFMDIIKKGSPVSELVLRVFKLIFLN